jgi:hypothetical protein
MLRFNFIYIPPIKLNALFLLATIISFGLAVLYGRTDRYVLLIWIALAAIIVLVSVLTNLLWVAINLVKRQPRVALLYFMAFILQLLFLLWLRSLIMAIPVGKLEGG